MFLQSKHDPPTNPFGQTKSQWRKQGLPHEGSPTVLSKRKKVQLGKDRRSKSSLNNTLYGTNNASIILPSHEYNQVAPRIRIPEALTEARVVMPETGTIMTHDGFNESSTEQLAARMQITGSNFFGTGRSGMIKDQSGSQNHNSQSPVGEGGSHRRSNLFFNQISTVNFNST